MPKRNEVPGVRRNPGFSGPAVLAAAGLLLALNVSIWSQNRGNQAALTQKLTALESQISQLSNKMDAVARGAAAPKGPDPNKVHTVRTEGRPVKGPSGAPVTIVEFSDFQ